MLGMDGSFHLPAGVLGPEFVEQVLERHEVGEALFCVLVVGDGNETDSLFREVEF